VSASSKMISRYSQLYANSFPSGEKALVQPYDPVTPSRFTWLPVAASQTVTSLGLPEIVASRLPSAEKTTWLGISPIRNANLCCPVFPSHRRSTTLFRATEASVRPSGDQERQRTLSP